MIIKPSTPDAYRLMHNGILALSRVEAAGIKVDVKYIRRTMKKLGRQIGEDETALRESEEYKKLRQRFGVKTNLQSRKQMATLFYEVYGHTPNSFTDAGNPQVDEQALVAIGTPFAKAFLRLEKLRKLNGTFLSGILRETEGDRLHASFNLHIPRTFRGSSDSPNFQNFPVRDPFMAEMIRSCFIAEEDFHIIETDYVGAEIRGAACYHKDPVMLRYIKNPAKDMHRDMAQQLFKMDSPDLVSKHARYCAKNMFVFPQFYGDFYMNNARQLWDAMIKMDLKVDGVPMIEHLRACGIESRGDCNIGRANPDGVGWHEPDETTFEHHVKMVENDFWNKRFKIYGQWKKNWLDEYASEGGLQMLSGFRIEGVLAKNDIINYPVQGFAFHWLLWSLIQIQKELIRRKMKSRIIGQIHDSLIGEVHKTEVGAYAQIVERVMCHDVRRHWESIIVPLNIEMEATEIGGTWFSKKKVDLASIMKGKICYDN